MDRAGRDAPGAGGPVPGPAPATSKCLTVKERATRRSSAGPAAWAEVGPARPRGPTAGGSGAEAGGPRPGAPDTNRLSLGKRFFTDKRPRADAGQV